MKPKFFYIRNENEFPVACIAHIEENGEVLFTWAVWNKKDKFSKQRFQEVAGGRLQRVLKENYTIAEYSFNCVGEKTAYGCLPKSVETEMDILQMLSSISISDNLEFTYVPFSLTKAASKYYTKTLEEQTISVLTEKYLEPFDDAIKSLGNIVKKEECSPTSQPVSSSSSNSMSTSSTSQV